MPIFISDSGGINPVYIEKIEKSSPPSTLFGG
jgi:hypothetical protein